MRDYDVNITAHYDEVARKEKEKSSSTMADEIIRSAETDFIAKMITDFIRQQKADYLINGRYAKGPGNGEFFSILDVGCGNGTTLSYLKANLPNCKLYGIEKNDSLREIAKSFFVKTDVEIRNGDVRKLETLRETNPDIIVCQRVLINLLDLDDQKLALDNLVKTVLSGGLLIFIESFEDGLNTLNEARKEFGIKELAPTYHNKYLPIDFFDHPEITIFDDSHEFQLSTHFFVTRVLHEFFIEKKMVMSLRETVILSDSFQKVWGRRESIIR